MDEIEDWFFNMYVTDGQHIRKVKMWRDNMGYKYASVRIGLCKTVTESGYYSDPAKDLLKTLQSLGWKRIDIESPFKRFLKFLKVI